MALPILVMVSLPSILGRLSFSEGGPGVKWLRTTKLQGLHTSGRSFDREQQVQRDLGSGTGILSSAIWRCQELSLDTSVYKATVPSLTYGHLLPSIIQYGKCYHSLLLLSPQQEELFIMKLRLLQYLYKSCLYPASYPESISQRSSRYSSYYQMIGGGMQVRQPQRNITRLCSPQILTGHMVPVFPARLHSSGPNERAEQSKGENRSTGIAQQSVRPKEIPGDLASFHLLLQAAGLAGGEGKIILVEFIDGARGGTTFCMQCTEQADFQQTCFGLRVSE